MTRPFDRARYEALLKGLDITVLKKSELENEFTIGAEYYSQEFVQSLAKLRESKAEIAHLADVCRLITDGDHGSSEYVDEGVPYILSEAVKEGWLDKNAFRFITKQRHASLPRSVLKPGDVVVTKTGVYFGKSAVIPEDINEANTIAHVGKLSVKPRAINPYFLSTFLNSRYGYHQLRRRGIKATRPEIKLIEFQEIEIPLLTSGFQVRVEATVRHAIAIQHSLQSSVVEAEQALLRALSPENWRLPEPLTYTRCASEALAAKRLDAQFFAPRYSALRKFFEKKFEVLELGRIGEVLKGITIPYDDEGTVPIIRSGDLADISDDSRFLRALPSQPIFELQRGDVLISSIGFGSIGKVQVFDKIGRYGTVGEVSVVRQNRLNPYYLTSFLRSFAGQMQIERFITGATGQLHLYPRDIARIFVPLLPDIQQAEFQQLAERAHESRLKARALLERAKRAVEVALEEGEEAGLALLGTGEGD